MTGSAREMLAWLAVNNPARLDEVAMAALTPDDPALDQAARDIQAEARRRVLAEVTALQEVN